MDNQQQALPADLEAILQPASTPTPQVIPAADPAQVPAAAPVVPPPAVQPTPPAEPQVPLHVLLEERRERQQLQAMLRQHAEAQYRATQPAAPPIDPVGDPEGFARAVLQQNAALAANMQDMAVHQRANTSEMIARGKHGDTAVDAAVKAAIDAGLNRNFMAKPDPYKELLNWHTAQTVAQTVGPDLNAFRQKVREEIIAEMRNGAKPGTQPLLPPSPSALAANASTAAPVVEDTRDFFKSMFAKPART